MADRVRKNVNICQHFSGYSQVFFRLTITFANPPRCFSPGLILGFRMSTQMLSFVNISLCSWSVVFCGEFIPGMIDYKCNPIPPPFHSPCSALSPPRRGLVLFLGRGFCRSSGRTWGASSRASSPNPFIESDIF